MNPAWRRMQVYISKSAPVHSEELRELRRSWLEIVTKSANLLLDATSTSINYTAVPGESLSFNRTTNVKAWGLLDASGNGVYGQMSQKYKKNEKILIPNVKYDGGPVMLGYKASWTIKYKTYIQDINTIKSSFPK